MFIQFLKSVSVYRKLYAFTIVTAGTLVRSMNSVCVKLQRGRGIMQCSVEAFIASFKIC